MSTSPLQSHISVLESSARSYPTRPAFRTPVVDKETSQISEWATITYAHLHKDVELYARYWTSILTADGIAPGSTVGLWYVSPLVLVSLPRLPTPRLITGLAAQHTPTCSTSTGSVEPATSLSCSAYAFLIRSSSSSCCRRPVPALCSANHPSVSTSRDPQSPPTQPSMSVSRMRRTVLYLR